MKEIIKKDLYRYSGKPYSFKLFLRSLRTQAFFYTVIFRYAQQASGAFSSLFWRLLLRRYSHKYGFQLDPKTDIGEGLYIGHFGTLIINGHAKIGLNCNLSPGVTIGRDHRGKRKGAPTIGNRVWIGTNAVIVGRVFIGNDVLIAPNSFVNFDVPDHSIVIGNPGKIIPRENAVEGYINNRI